MSTDSAIESDIEIPSVDFPIRPNTIPASACAGLENCTVVNNGTVTASTSNSGTSVSSSPLSNAASMLANALNPASALASSAASALGSTAGAVASGSTVTGAVSQYITSNLSRWITIILGLIIIAAGVFSFSKVQEVAGEGVRAAIA
jgi:hypothetical protein